MAISFSGGVDSTIIATIARRHADVELFTAGVEGSPDLESAERVADDLCLPLHKVIFDEKAAMEAYGKIYRSLPLDFLKVEILVPVHMIASAACSRGHSVILFGSGAEELFVGYERYYVYKEEGKDLEQVLKDEFRTLPQRDIGWIQKTCRRCGIEARFPFYNKKMADMMFSVPLDDRMDDREMKKGILREAGKIIGAPEIALQRKKKAMQYGTGVHKMLIKRVDEINANYPSL